MSDLEIDTILEQEKVAELASQKNYETAANVLDENHNVLTEGKAPSDIVKEFGCNLGVVDEVEGEYKDINFSIKDIGGAAALESLMPKIETDFCKLADGASLIEMPSLQGIKDAFGSAWDSFSSQTAAAFNAAHDNAALACKRASSQAEAFAEKAFPDDEARAQLARKKLADRESGIDITSEVITEGEVAKYKKEKASAFVASSTEKIDKVKPSITDAGNAVNTKIAEQQKKADEAKEALKKQAKAGLPSLAEIGGKIKAGASAAKLAFYKSMCEQQKGGDAIASLAEQIVDGISSKVKDAAEENGFPKKTALIIQQKVKVDAKVILSNIPEPGPCEKANEKQKLLSSKKRNELAIATGDDNYKSQDKEVTKTEINARCPYVEHATLQYILDTKTKEIELEGTGWFSDDKVQLYSGKRIKTITWKVQKGTATPIECKTIVTTLFDNGWMQEGLKREVAVNVLSQTATYEGINKDELTDYGMVAIDIPTKIVPTVVEKSIFDVGSGDMEKYQAGLRVLDVYKICKCTFTWMSDSNVKIELQGGITQKFLKNKDGSVRPSAGNTYSDWYGNKRYSTTVTIGDAPQSQWVDYAKDLADEHGTYGVLNTDTK